MDEIVLASNICTQSILNFFFIFLLYHLWRLRLLKKRLLLWKLLVFFETEFDPAGRIAPHVRLRSKSWYNDSVLNDNWPTSEFIRYFRLHPQCFYYVLDAIEDDIRPRTQRSVFGNSPILPHKKLCIFLYRLSSRGTTCFDVAIDFGVSESTVTRVTKQVANAIILRLGHLIHFPDTVDAMKEKSRQWRDIMIAQGEQYIPGVIGAIDGSFIAIYILKFMEDGERNSYFNRKCFLSMTLQLIVDARHFIMDMFFGYPSRQPDSTVLRASYFGQVADALFGQDGVRGNNGCKYFIIGDSGYPIRSWLLAPYRRIGNLTASQIHFNLVLSKCRVVVENTFADLKNRWRRLKLLDVDIDNMAPLVQCACILHNICILFDDPVPPRDEDDDDDDDDDDNNNNNNDEVPDNINTNVQAWRNSLKDLIWDEYQNSWQSTPSNPIKLMMEKYPIKSI